jgi:hypothetical protein
MTFGLRFRRAIISSTLCRPIKITNQFAAFKRMKQAMLQAGGLDIGKCVMGAVSHSRETIRNRVDAQRCASRGYCRGGEHDLKIQAFQEFAIIDHRLQEFPSDTEDSADAVVIS